MKKIVLFVFMMIASVNLFSNDMPGELIYYSKKAYYFYNLVLEDVKNNDDIIELKDGYYLGMFDNETFGHFTYKMKVTKNIERKIYIIFKEGITYHYVIFQTETLSGLLLTFCNIRIFSNENKLLCEVDYCLEGDNVIYECCFDPTTFIYYTNK